MRKRVVFAAVVAVLYLAAWWLVNGETSPLYDFFLDHVGVSNTLATLSLPAIMVGVVVSDNVHQPSGVGTVLAMFVQWFIIGWLASMLIFKRQTRQGNDAR